MKKLWSKCIELRGEFSNYPRITSIIILCTGNFFCVELTVVMSIIFNPTKRNSSKLSSVRSKSSPLGGLSSYCFAQSCAKEVKRRCRTNGRDAELLKSRPLEKSFHETCQQKYFLCNKIIIFTLGNITCPFHEPVGTSVSSEIFTFQL